MFIVTEYAALSDLLHMLVKAIGKCKCRGKQFGPRSD